MESITTTTATSSIVYLMKNYTSYNLWANATLIKWLRTKPADLLEKEVPSSFPGIKPTLQHIWQTQVFWLSVIKKETMDAVAPFEGSLDELFTLLLEQSATFAEYVDQIDQMNLEDNTLVVNPWFQCDFQNFEYIMQVMNHSTYHRGQVITIGRQLGFTDAPMTDYNYYNVMGK